MWGNPRPPSLDLLQLFLPESLLPSTPFTNSFLWLFITFVSWTDLTYVDLLQKDTLCSISWVNFTDVHLTFNKGLWPNCFSRIFICLLRLRTSRKTENGHQYESKGGFSLGFMDKSFYLMYSSVCLWKLVVFVLKWIKMFITVRGHPLQERGP